MTFRRILLGLSIIVSLGLANCQQTLTVGTFSISYTNTGSKTDFVVTAPLSDGITTSNAWIGVGFNTRGAMVRKS